MNTTEDTFSIPSDVIGTLSPLCPSDIAPADFAILTSKNEAAYPPKTAADLSDQAQNTRRSGNDDSDITGSSLLDTIHYLSPVSALSPRTVYEGDIVDYYKLFEPKKYVKSEPSTLSSSTISIVEPHLQRTIAIVKPDAMVYQDVIVRAITKAGFSFIEQRTIHFTPEQISEFYCQYYGSPAFPHQVVSMSVGPVLVLSLADVAAVSKWRDMIGSERVLREEWFYPMSMRARFGLQEAMADAAHASENLKDAYRESRYVYPRHVLEPIVQGFGRVTDFCGVYVNSTLLNGLVQLVKTKPKDPVMYLAEWLLSHNPYQPQYDKDIGLVPT